MSAKDSNPATPGEKLPRLPEDVQRLVEERTAELARINEQLRKDLEESQRANKSFAEALERSRQLGLETTALVKASRAILDSKSFEEAARIIFDCCEEVTGATSGYVTLLAKDGSRNDVLFLDSGGRPCEVDPDLPAHVRGLREVVCRTGRTAYENNFPASEWVEFIPPGHMTLDNVMFAPLRLEGKTVGLFGVANKPGGFTDRDARVAEAFGELAAVALRNSLTLQALQESENRYRSLVEAISEWVWEVDPGGALTYCSPQIQDLLGHPAEDALGKTPLDFMSEGEAQRVSGPFRDTLQSQEPFAGFEAVFLHRDGQRVVLETGGVPIRDADGDYRGFRCVSRDTTQRTRAEQREAALQSQLAHMGRLTTMGELASGLAHELNQPLAAIAMFAAVAAHEAKADGEQGRQKLIEACDDIGEQARRAGQLIHRMRQFVKKIAPRRTALNLRSVVDEILPLVQNDFRHAGIPLNIDVDRALPMIWADKLQVEQVLLNLVRNGLEAMQRTDFADHQLSVAAKAGEGRLEIAVRDTGDGIPKDRFHDLFGTFYTTKPEGMGMGLAISRVYVYVADC